MQLRLEPVTQENRLAVLSLRAGTGQEGFVETVSACLDEAAQRAVGSPFLEGYVRLLIDAARQGRGYGRAAVASLLARLAEEYGPRDIYLSVVDGNTAAARLYEAFGFVFTEERDVHGEHVMRRPAAPVRGS